MNQPPLSLFIVSGSHRPESQSGKVARWIESALSAQSIATDLLDLARDPLPFWEEGVWDDTEFWKKHWWPVRDRLRAADALVVVVPEWGGMVPPALKNFLLLCSGKELGHKPGLIVGVSSGVSGTYPVAELRLSGTKNNRLCWIPDHVIVRHVEGVLNTPPGAPVEKDSSDDFNRRRLAQGLGALQAYARALQVVRESPEIRAAEFGNGM
jgi:NAD(P)H-dependent FMN reductase